MTNVVGSVVGEGNAVADDKTASGPQSVATDRAVRLFRFLARSQQLKSNSPRTTDSYDSVLWFDQLPQHLAIRSTHRAGSVEPGAALLTVDRVPHQEPPEPPAELLPWLDGDWDSPGAAPRLREWIDEPQPTDPSEDAADVEVRRIAPADAPQILGTHAEWAARWTAWSEQEQTDQPARAVYNDLFSMHVTVAGHIEELELVVAVGCLSWSPGGHPVVRRHLATVPAVIQFDDSTGRLSLRQSEAADGLHVELDMLDPGRVANPHNVALIRDEAREVTAVVLDRDDVGALLRRLVHALDSDAAYLDQDDPQQPGPHAVVAFAPAVILRRRSRQGIVDILDSVATQLEQSQSVPEGLLPLVDPDHRPTTERSAVPGALVSLDTDLYLPLPVNDRQLRVLTQVDAKAQTLVQGPPGTGKTHTVAALLSHLLAQGKRVLVTAHTDRALKEVRDKLPEAIAPLAVAVVGSARSDLADLKVAVERISHVAGEYDAEGARRAIDEHLAAIEQLRQRRAGLHRRLLDARGQEVAQYEVGEYRGTLAAIAQRVAAEQDRFGWVADITDIVSVVPSPVHPGDIVQWHRSVVDEALNADEPESRLRLLRLADVPTPDAFLALVVAEPAGR